ncbi:MAG: DUF302 domain-containing protein [Thermodesulfobacteriota bacterium]
MGFLLGLVVGIALMGVAVWVLMPKLMIRVYRSRLSFEETVSAIERNALSGHWKVPKIYDLQQTLQEAGHEDMTPVKILSICQPHHAYNILKNDADKIVTAIMPCRIGVFRAKDGGTRIAEMNMGLMSRMFGGNIAHVMSGVALEEAAMIRPLIE